MGKYSDKKKKKKIWIIIIIVFAILITTAIVTGYLYVKNKLDKIQTVDINKEDLSISNNAEETLEKYRNIAILGVDSRGDDYGLDTRSDCIIIASINNYTGDIKLVSVYRDTFVEIEGHGLDKINHAYAYGQASLLLKTLNRNFDLNIQEFVTVNFGVVIEAIDKLGGITLDITADETKYINSYINDINRIQNKSSKHITKAGTYTLDGVQALAYSRIRYTEGGDYKRTERMRTVIEAMFNKLKARSIGEINSFADTILPHVYTNISAMEMLKFVPNITKYKVVESIGFPYNVKPLETGGWYGVPVTLESNVTKLHKEVFLEENYEPSETVKQISQSIVNKTGYKE